jgi:DNA (cytosine-5)-methyltransferase 1
LERKRNGTDAQTARIEDYWRFVAELRPRAFVMENVPGLAFSNHEEILRSVERRARRNGYSVATAILDAADFGVPQARRRLFVVGIRGRKRFEFPKPTFEGDLARTAGWAFADLNDTSAPPEPDEHITGRYTDLLPLVPPGDNYLFFTKRRNYPQPVFGWRKRYWSFLLKLSPSRPSPTIAATRVTNNGPFHWENRRLRLRELARLQTFPDSFALAERRTARRHLGNAVPPLLAAQLLWHLRVWLGDVSDTAKPDPLARALAREATAAQVSAALGTGLLPQPVAADVSGSRNRNRRFARNA